MIKVIIIVLLFWCSQITPPPKPSIKDATDAESYARSDSSPGPPSLVAEASDTPSKRDNHSTNHVRLAEHVIQNNHELVLCDLNMSCNQGLVSLSP